METRNIDRRRQMLIGRAKKLAEAGYSAKEIAEELKISESTVRSYQEVIEQAEKNKA